MDPDPTSNPPSTNRSVYRSIDENWAENISITLHDLKHQVTGARTI